MLYPEVLEYLGYSESHGGYLSTEALEIERPPSSAVASAHPSQFGMNYSLGLGANEKGTNDLGCLLVYEMARLISRLGLFCAHS